MSIYNTYDVVLHGSSVDGDQEAGDWAKGFVFGEIGTTEQEIKYGRHVETVDDVEVYYDLGADYYFFVPVPAPPSYHVEMQAADGQWFDAGWDSAGYQSSQASGDDKPYLFPNHKEAREAIEEMLEALQFAVRCNEITQSDATPSFRVVVAK